MASFEIVTPEPKPVEVIKLNLTLAEANALHWIVYQSQDEASASNLSKCCSDREKEILAPFYELLGNAIDSARTAGVDRG